MRREIRRSGDDIPNEILSILSILARGYVVRKYSQHRRNDMFPAQAHSLAFEFNRGAFSSGCRQPSGFNDARH